MFSEVDNPQDSSSLANEASLVAMLGLSDQAAANEESEIDPEMALEVLLSDKSLNQLVLRRQQDGVESITGYYRVPVEPCLLYTSPSPRDATLSRMPSSA